MISEKITEYPLVSIVIPTLNSKKDIVRCLHSDRRLDYPNKYIEIIIWDNGSTYGTQEEISRIFAEMKKEGWNELNIMQAKWRNYSYTKKTSRLFLLLF
ncbi:MAG: glycosyltransferase [Candidatus Scalindua sp.]